MKNTTAASDSARHSTANASVALDGKDTPMQSLPIIWQRLVNSDGKTCDRCDATYQALRRAVTKLKPLLRTLGIQPTIRIKKIDERTFKARPSESNRIWIGGKPMEEWLGARVGNSQCCSVCGEAACRTLQVDGTTFEAIPTRVLVKAVLIASSQMLGPKRSRGIEQSCEQWAAAPQGNCPKSHREHG
jgi:hypothetical protein